MDHMDQQLDLLGRIVQNTIAPAFLLGAVAMQMRVLNNRLSRIVDRQRWLMEHAGVMPGTAVPPAEHRHETGVLMQRQRAIQRAILLAGMCALLVCCVIVAMFVEDALDLGMGFLVAILFIAGLANLVLSYLFFLDEIFLSMRKLKLTIRGSRRLLE
jgi:hypothetical protein